MSSYLSARRTTGNVASLCHLYRQGRIDLPTYRKFASVSSDRYSKSYAGRRPHNGSKSRSSHAVPQHCDKRVGPR
jgi:hypothetical protein